MKGLLSTLILTLAVAAVNALVSPVAQADELLVTMAKSGRGGAVSVDFDNRTGTAVGFEFKIAVPTDAKVDTRQCLSDLPKTHTGVCVFNNIEGYVVAMVFSNVNKALPQGVVSVGHFTVRAGTQPLNVKVLHFLAADVDAKETATTTKVVE